MLLDFSLSTLDFAELFPKRPVGKDRPSRSLDRFLNPALPGPLGWRPPLRIRPTRRSSIHVD
jgi:hypothetical protein